MSESNRRDHEERRARETDGDEASGDDDAPATPAGSQQGSGAEAAGDASESEAAAPADTKTTETAPATPAGAEPGTEMAAYGSSGDDPSAGDETTTDPDSGDGGAAAPAGADSGGAGRRRWLMLALVVIALAVVTGLASGGGYLYWRIQQLDERVAAVPDERERALERFARSKALAQSMERLEGKVTTEVERLEKAVDDVSASADERAQALRERVDNLKEAVATARELAGRDQLDWRLAEVHYLVAVAARRLMIAHDRRAAIAAMEAADRSLAEVGDVRLLDLRQRLVDDISALHQTEPADVEGIAVRIQSLLQRIPDLPPQRQRASGGSASDGEGSGASAEAQDWWQRLREGLSSYVVVRRQGGANGPARPQADRSLPAGEKLGYALSEARRAALRREPDPYTQAIQRARSILDEDFAEDSPAVGYFRETLAELEQRGVTTAYPDLTSTLDFVEKVTAELKARRERPDLVGSDEEG